MEIEIVQMIKELSKEQLAILLDDKSVIGKFRTILVKILDGTS